MDALNDVEDFGPSCGNNRIFIVNHYPKSEEISPSIVSDFVVWQLESFRWQQYESIGCDSLSRLLWPLSRKELRI